MDVPLWRRALVALVAKSIPNVVFSSIVMMIFQAATTPEGYAKRGSQDRDSRRT